MRGRSIDFNIVAMHLWHRCLQSLALKDNWSVFSVIAMSCRSVSSCGADILSEEHTGVSSMCIEQAGSSERSELWQPESWLWWQAQKCPCESSSNWHATERVM